MNLKNAHNIKSILIDYLILKNQDIVVGNEVMYGSNGRLADIIQLYKNKVYAFEIKAENDDLRKLFGQIDDYIQVFDFLYLVLTQNHLEKLNSKIELLNPQVGIITIKEDKIIIIRKATINREHNKKEILETINSKYLRTYFKISSKLNSFQTRNYLLAEKDSTIKNILYQYFYDIVSPRYNIFIKERGLETHYEDVSILSMYNRLIY